jgi:hypothetical protein
LKAASHKKIVEAAFRQRGRGNLMWGIVHTSRVANGGLANLAENDRSMATVFGPENTLGMAFLTDRPSQYAQNLSSITARD